jgi:hypothetical protein
MRMSGIAPHWQDPDSSFVLTLLHLRHVRWERSSSGSVGKTHCRRVPFENSGGTSSVNPSEVSLTFIQYFNGER